MQGQHGAAPRIQRHHPADQRVAEQLDRELLQVEVDVRVHRRRGLGQQVLPRPGLAHYASACVHLHEPRSLAPAKLALVLPLQPVLPHLLARLVAAERGTGEFVLVDFTRVSDERGDRRSVGVVPFWRALDDQPRELHPVLLEHRHHVEGRVGEDHGGPVGRAAETPDRLVDLLRRERDRPRQAPERGAQRIDARCQERDRIPRQVLGDDLPPAVVDDAARRRQRHLAQAVLLGLQHVLRVLQHLRPEERAHQEDERQEQQRGSEPRPALHLVRVEAHPRGVPTTGRTSTSTTSPTAAVNAAASGDQSSACTRNSLPLSR